MAEYLAEEYSPCIYAHFTTATVAIAESMEWDAALKKPISANQSLHQDIKNITFSCKILDPSSLSTPTSRPLVNFDNLMVASLDNPAPAQPLLSTVVPTSASTLAAKDRPSVSTTGSTHLLVQQLQAQVLAMSGNPPPADNLLVGTSMSTKDLLCHLQLQVNSLSAAGTQQPGSWDPSDPYHGLLTPRLHANGPRLWGVTLLSQGSPHRQPSQCHLLVLFGLAHYPHSELRGTTVLSCPISPTPYFESNTRT